MEPMITGGVETIVGIVQEPVFGPVMVFGHGVATEVLGDRVARLAPLTTTTTTDAGLVPDGARPSGCQNCA